MMETLAGPRLPELKHESQALIRDAALFVFEGKTSDLLHPDIERADCFPDHTIMPVQELPIKERIGIVAFTIFQSLSRTILDTLKDWESINTQVSDPHAYYELLKDGKKIHRLNEKSGPLIDFDILPGVGSDVEEHVVAGLVYHEFARVMSGEPKAEKRGLRVLKNASPQLVEGETKESRRQAALQAKEDKLFCWRYGRTLAVAGAAGAFAITSLIGAHSVEHKNAPRIAAIEHDRQASYDEIPNDVRKVVDIFLNDGKATALLSQSPDTIAAAQKAAKKIDTLDTEAIELKRQSSNKSNNALLLGVLSVGALGRFGLWRLGRPKKQKS